ncbi:aldo/keto reductase [Rhodococcus qingshengii]|uniref:aldo/keto reductase n=1 Tax=Rhodococcus qingshengii TaxID=334542 RepID=UPI0024B9B7A9|nr:aldo/keto reductase [Rhodococcus qingshengii]MDJ0441436.1 aldo/keto reductase [Rhodococcus qingshengii]
MIDGIGLSNVDLGQLRHAMPADIACVQNVYNLLDRTHEPMLTECREHDVAFVPFFPLGSGFPGARRVTEDPVVGATADRTGTSPAQVGLAWLLAHARNILLIPGTADVAHLELNIAAGDLVLDDAAISRLDTVCS